MGANQHFTRLDTLELKALLYRKIGQQRADKYFVMLDKLFTLQLSKNSFDKLCIRTIGRENLPLHNRLISSIVKNAAFAKVPPPSVKKLANSLNGKVDQASQRNSLQSLNVDVSSFSSRRRRAPRGRRSKDWSTPLGSNWSNWLNVDHEVDQSPTELHSLGSIPPTEVLSVEDGEEVASVSPGVQSRGPVTAPLGISIKTGPTRKTLNHACGYGSRPWSHTCENSFELLNSRDLRSRLKHKLEGEGVSISEDCANLLNAGLDAYLKRLMEPFIGLARSRTSQTAPGYNGTLPSGLHTRSSAASVLDFRLAMDCDSSKLGGGDWLTQYNRGYVLELLDNKTGMERLRLGELS